MHLPHPDGDSPFADWQMYNNWGPKFKSNILEQSIVWITKSGFFFFFLPAWPQYEILLVCFMFLFTHYVSIHNPSSSQLHNWGLCQHWWLRVHRLGLLLQLSQQTRADNMNSKQKLHADKLWSTRCPSGRDLHSGRSNRLRRSRYLLWVLCFNH